MGNHFQEQLTFHDIFPDENLALGIARAFNRQPKDAVTIEELNHFSERLNLDKLGIEKLEGVQHLISILHLELDHNEISDIEPLRSLSRLNILNLAANNISSVEPLKDLNNLNQLIIVQNKISDIEPLSYLNLVNLSIASNKVTDLNPLSGLNRLMWLNLDDNQISDVEPLKELIHLQRLDLNYNTIIDLQPLKGLTNLLWLHLNHNRITDLSSLASLKADIRANHQRIELPCILFGEVTDDLLIRNLEGQTPKLTFIPEGGTYDPEIGKITWGAEGKNTLSWDEPNFSGTIIQIVSRSYTEGLRFIWGQSAELIGYTGSCRDVVIPSVVTNQGIEYTVTIIHQHALQDKKLTSIKVPITVKHIPNFAFANNPLENVEISNPDTTFGEDPFRFSRISYITVPEGSAIVMKDKLNFEVMGADNYGAILREDSTPRYRWTNQNQWVAIE